MACSNARKLSRICELLEGELGVRRARGARELGEELGARAFGMSYAELEQFDTQSSFYDPDVGPYYWED